MDEKEIFTKLLAMREKMEADNEAPMLASDNALLYDMARTLGLTEQQAETLAGDDAQPQPAAPAQTLIDSGTSYDFSASGLGIGGLGTHQEKPIIPTVAAIKRVERLEAEMTVCRRCGASDVFDGAMFTDGGGDICDDCF